MFIDTDSIFKDENWHWSHGADEPFLGTGILYYAVTYMLKADTAVCLGSGSGFVPRCMKAAQRECHPNGRTILIDGNTGNGAPPDWLDENAYFQREWADIEKWVMRAGEGAKKLRHEGIQIDYLHIDADHSHEGSRQDFDNYAPLLRTGGMISLHDTRFHTVAPTFGVHKTIEDIRNMPEWEVIEMGIGAGLALVKRRSE